jgi:hypothetical protein
MRKAAWTTSSSGPSEPDRLRPPQLGTWGVQTRAKHGVNKRLKCGICKIVMKLVRREAHPARGPLYELHTYACAKCGHIEQASTESPGGIG